MIPPTSIDGTDITGATIDGTDVQEITVDGDVVFSSGPDFILQPRSNDLQFFNGDTSDFSIDSNSPVFTGNLSFKFNGSDSVLASTSGLDNYPQVGQRHIFYAFLDGGDTAPRVFIYNDDANDPRNGDAYEVQLRKIENIVVINERTNGSGNKGSEFSQFLPVQEWLEVSVLHSANGDLNVVITDNGGSGTEIFNKTATGLDANITNGAYDTQGIGFRSFTSDLEVIDFWHIP